MNDGPNGAPGTLFFESGSFVLAPIAPYPEPALHTLSVGPYFVPDTFTWTVTWSGSALFGLVGFDPPTIGSNNAPFIWTNDSNLGIGWLGGAGGEGASLEARVIAIDRDVV